MTSFTEGFTKGLDSLSPQKRALLELLRQEEPEHMARDRPITSRCVFSPSPQSAAQQPCEPHFQWKMESLFR